MMKRKVRPIIWRLFHKKKKRTRLTKTELKFMESHLQMHHDMIARERQEAMTIDGQLYEAAVEKFTEIMMERVKVGEAPLTETSFVPDIPVIRVSKIPELLLSFGVRIKG